MIEIGNMNNLIVHEKFGGGYLLRADDLDIDIILPHKEITTELTIGEKIKAFVYVDKDEKPMATLSRPSALVGEFAVMKIKEAHQFGAFADWGITKDLLIPDTEQKDRVGVGQFYIVRVCLDERTNKVYGTTKVGKYIQGTKFDIKENDKVKVIPVKNEDLGYRCLINDKFIGMIYYNEVYDKIKFGDEIEGFVKKLRSDGLVDVSLQSLGIRNVVSSQDKILAYLERVGGKSHLHDKSSPEEIRSILKMSKKTFKSSIGMLYKQRKIIIHKDGIELAGPNI